MVARNVRLRKICCLGLGARLLGGVTGGLGDFLGCRKRLLPIPQLGDVAGERHETAVLQRLEIELDAAAAHRSPLVMVASRLEYLLCPLLNDPFDIVGRARTAPPPPA